MDALRLTRKRWARLGLSYLLVHESRMYKHARNLPRSECEKLAQLRTPTCAKTCAIKSLFWFWFWCCCWLLVVGCWCVCGVWWVVVLRVKSDVQRVRVYRAPYPMCHVRGAVCPSPRSTAPRWSHPPPHTRVPSRALYAAFWYCTSLGCHECVAQHERLAPTHQSARRRPPSGYSAGIEA